MSVPASVTGLYLPSSYDWPVKLWHADYSQSLCTYSMMRDYVYDVKWCHGGKPDMFACCDGDKTINVFDLAQDLTQPISTPMTVPMPAETHGVQTTLEWGGNGKYLCCGDSDGSLRCACIRINCPRARTRWLCVCVCLYCFLSSLGISSLR